MNNCNFIGRLTKDPELKNTNNGKTLCNFSIAVDRGYKDNQGNKVADFIPCIAWDSKAKLISMYFKKGNLIGIQGRMESKNYEDNGTKRTAYNILVNDIDFIQGKVEMSEAKDEAKESTPQVEDKVKDELAIDGDDSAGELPFNIFDYD